MHPISYFQAAVLGLLQGAAELFPISSLGHGVIAPRLLGWDIHQDDDFFLTFLVATHLATALVLLGFFWRDWVRIVRGLGRSVAARRVRVDDAAERLRRHAPVREDATYSDERVVRELSVCKAAGIGTAQAIALLPGFSRSGATMSGGLIPGLSNEDAGGFAFLLPRRSSAPPPG